MLLEKFFSMLFYNSKFAEKSNQKGDTAPLLLTLQHSLFLKPPTPLPNSSMMLPLLPFLSAASTVLLKPGGLLKSQMPSQNAERHLRRHTVPKKTASTISLHPDIPPL